MLTATRSENVEKIDKNDKGIPGRTGARITCGPYEMLAYGRIMEDCRTGLGHGHVAS